MERTRELIEKKLEQIILKHQMVVGAIVDEG